MDTIYALASGQGKAGVAVVRLSGPQAHEALRRLAGRVPEFRQMSLATLEDGNGGLLDKALVVAFPEGSSFTGEKVVELHLHGSVAVVAAVMSELEKQGLSRIATPGEFTRRALENGRLDLTEVEGLADLIQSETEAQRKQALNTLSGALGKKVARWRLDLVHAMALTAASIDFADEDLPEDFNDETAQLIRPIIAELVSEISGVTAAERVRDGFQVAILGRPNSGKSTLLNTLSGREAALTSDVAGTTRDVIEVRMDIGGLPVTLLDTAGLRETDDEVEQMGVALARSRAQSADLRIVLIDDAEPLDNLDLEPDDIILQAKADLKPGVDGVSGKTGAGVERLLERLKDILLVRASQTGAASHHRHRVAMGQAKTALDSVLDEIQHGFDRSEFISEHLRESVQALDELVGKVDVEDVLDDIFRNFCLGK